MMNCNLSDIINPEILKQLNYVLQTQHIDYESQPAAILKMLHTIDDLFEAYKNVAPEHKAQAQYICTIKVLSEIKNGSFNY